MPELPEMENYKNLLQQLVAGQKISAIEINREKSINLPVADFQRQVTSQRIIAIDRRAKYLIFRLESGVSLLLHLMLGGTMFYGSQEEKPDRTVQVQLSFGGRHLYFIGLRLGYLHLLTPELLKKELEKLGPEPLAPAFSEEAFLARMKNKRGGLKTTLLNQDVIAGIGNRYSDEILWHAELYPDRKCNELDKNHLVRLYRSIRFILQRGIENGGYMGPLYNGDNRTGRYQMAVHDREGEACSRCGAAIVKMEHSSRNTFFCENCQR